MSKPNLYAVDDDGKSPITKPDKFNLDRFRSTKPPAVAGVAALQTGLHVFRLAEVNDFFRLHPDEDRFWSDELCFVPVPIKGQTGDTLQLIAEDVALKYLASGRIQHFRLALGTKPHDGFFLGRVPTRNPDNSYNMTCVQGCQAAKTHWVQLTSRKAEGVDSYKIDYALDEDAFPEPQWPEQSLIDLIERAFPNRVIDHAEHPALKRLLGAKQTL
jgi:hypothetical protein